MSAVRCLSSVRGAVVGVVAGAVVVAGALPADAGERGDTDAAGPERPTRAPELAASGVPDTGVRASAEGVRVRGRGYGHGIGMSQYGAEGAARKGIGYPRILRYYYPGTKLADRHTVVRVRITAGRKNPVVVRKAPGLFVRDGRDGRKFVLPRRKGIRAWRIVPARGKPARSVVQFRNAKGWNRWKVPGRGLLRGDGTFRRPGPLRLVLPSGAIRRYRGGLRAASTSRSSGDRDTVNVLRLQHYLKGVVAKEMPASWSQRALRAQAVAARSYALHLKARSSYGHYDLCDTTTCQVYGGMAAEAGSTTRAVQATLGKTVVYKGEAALTMFSSSSGGWTASGGLPYLKARRDRHDRWSGNPVRSWGVGVSRARLRSVYPSIGRFERARVVRRNGHGAWNGRAVRVVLVGSKSRVRVSGSDFRTRFGLPSDWFRF